MRIKESDNAHSGILLMAAGQSADTAKGDDGRAQSFQAVEGGGNLHSGEVLLVQAYAAIWLLVLFFIARTYRRQRAMDARIAQLNAELAKLGTHQRGQSAAAESGAQSDGATE